MKPAERSTIQLAEDDYLVAIRPLGPADERPVGRPSSRSPDERTLIDELWRISHFGWIPEAVIRRALTLARGGEMPSDALHRGLRQLLDRGWVEHRSSDSNDGEHHWRLDRQRPRCPAELSRHARPRSTKRPRRGLRQAFARHLRRPKPDKPEEVINRR